MKVTRLNCRAVCISLFILSSFHARLLVVYCVDLCVDLVQSFPNSNKYLVANISFDTAENEPCGVSPDLPGQIPQVEMNHYAWMWARMTAAMGGKALSFPVDEYTVSLQAVQLGREAQISRMQNFASYVNMLRCYQKFGSY